MTRSRMRKRCDLVSRMLCRGIAWATLASLAATTVLAVVTITGFDVEAGDGEIFVNWETASEIDNLGFYVWRSESETTGYVKVPLDAPSEQFIDSQDDSGVGALYEFVDAEVTPGIRYYYEVEDVPASGGSTRVGPISAMVPLPATATSAPGSPTPTPTPGVPTSTPTPGVRFWADPAQVSAGDCSTVLWQTEDVQAVYFDGAAAPGEGARAFCVRADEIHVLRVQYRDDSWEDFTVTILVSGAGGAGTGSSPLATPTVRSTPRPTGTSLATNVPSATSAPAATGGAAPPTVTPRPSLTTAAPQQPVSPVGTPPNGAALQDATAGVAPSPLASPMPAATVTRAPGVLVSGSAVEADGASRSPYLWVGLALALVLGSALVVGGLWLWKRGP